MTTATAVARRTRRRRSEPAREEEDEVREEHERPVDADAEERLLEQPLEARSQKVRERKAAVDGDEIRDEQDRSQYDAPVLLQTVDDPSPLFIEVDERHRVGQRLPRQAGPRALARVAVAHRAVGDVVDLPAASPHAVAPVDVLEVHEKALVHESDAGERLFPHHHARAGDPIDLARRLVVEVEHEVVPQGPAVLEDPPQGRPTEDEGPERVEAAARVLQRAVGVQELAASDRRVRVLVHEREQAIDGAACDDDVRIQDQDVPSPRRADPLVHGSRIAEVRRVLDEANPGEPLLQEVTGTVGRVVVDDDRLGRGLCRVLLDRGEALRQGLAAVVADNDDRDVERL